MKPSLVALLLVSALAACAPAPAQLAGGGGPQALIAPPVPAATAQAPSETADLLGTTDVPVRDRIALAQRFLGLGDIPRAASAPPPAYAIGDERSFIVDNTDTDEQFTITARLVYVTEHAYWWLEQGFDVDAAGLARSAERFERQIYPTTRRYFGSEWSPGVDNDPHIYILMAEQLGGSVLGYFYSSSEYPRQAVPNSNEAEIFLMSASNMAPYVGTDYFDSVLAHEFQHMIHWAVDVNEESWVNEGLSELSTLLNGFSFLSHIPSFMSNPATQLTHWPEDDQSGPHYGAGHLFFTYMLERFGEEAIVRVVSEPANGMVGVEQALRAIGATDSLTGAPVSADGLFADWVVANYLNDPDAGDGRYAYSLLPELGALPPTQSYSVYPVYVEGREWPQYAADYILLRGSGRVRLAFAGQPQVGLLPASAHSGRYMFWGNRADDSDATLTRAFDLTGCARATLEYWTWYHIESLWDYAYVTVSTDGGQTWTILETPNTTRENPHSNAYGPGYTGRSGGDAEPVWTQERLDLTPYVGRQIMVRFEYVTDDLTLQPGFAIDDVAIPEIGYSEGFEEGDGGWESAGWIRHDNVLPQRFVVQMIEVYGDGTARVVRILGPEDAPRRAWEIKLDDEVSGVVVVVSGLAPATTEPAVYTFSVEPVTD